MRIKRQKERQAETEKEARRREAEERQKAQFRQIMRLARTDIEKIVAQDASEKDYEDAWDYLKEVSEHGCSSGIVSGLIYYTDTTKFYQAHKAEIWEQLSEDAENVGESVLSYMANSRWGADIDDPDVFENQLAWYGYEAACQRLLDRHEDYDENENDDNDENENPHEPNLDIDV